MTEKYNELQKETNQYATEKVKMWLSNLSINAKKRFDKCMKLINDNVLSEL